MSSEQSKNIFRTVKEYFLITLGILIYTCGWTIFLTPNNMFGGGVSGISAIIQFATGIKLGYSYFAINALLLIISLFIIGPSFGVKTVYAIFLASFCLNFEQTIIPAQFIQDFALSNGKLLCAWQGDLAYRCVHHWVFAACAFFWRGWKRTSICGQIHYRRLWYDRGDGLR